MAWARSSPRTSPTSQRSCRTQPCRRAGRWSPSVATIVAASAFLFVLVPRLGKMKLPVIAYFAVIMAMVAAAWSVPGASWMLGAGAVIFALSDSLIAVRKFLQPFPGSHIAVWTTYVAAQFMMTLGLPRLHRSLRLTHMHERQLDIETKDGRMTTFVVHPERDGPHPIILFYMDAPGIREELRDMARRIASVGYYVMLPNLYYRQNVMELGPLPTDPEAPERKRMMRADGKPDHRKDHGRHRRHARLRRQRRGRQPKARSARSATA